MQFADDAAAWFGGDGYAAHMLDAGEREQLQQAALAHRLEGLLPRLPLLAAMAEAQGFDAGIALDDAPRLFYPHTIYKAYDPAWLRDLDFARMTEWANRMVARDLVMPAGQHFSTIDGWLAWMESEFGLDVAHSTGTTGRMSLVFRDAKEAARRFARIDMSRRDWHRARGFSEDESELHIIWPGPRRGRSALQNVVRHWVETLPDEGQLAALHSHDLGADYELYVVGARNARERGVLEIPQPGQYVEAKLEEADRRHAAREEDLARLIETAASTMKGKRVMVLGGPLGVHAVASAGLANGLSGSFGETSFTCRLGGFKGINPPANFEETITTFMGTDHMMSGYGMTELNAGFIGCEAGRYHVPPWIVAWVLDPTSGWSPKPRTGQQEGRGAFMDLATMNNWGGLVTSDHINLSYEPCSCGRTSPSIAANVIRVEDGELDFSFLPAGEAVQALLQFS